MVSTSEGLSACCRSASGIASATRQFLNNYTLGGHAFLSNASCSYFYCKVYLQGGRTFKHLFLFFAPTAKKYSLMSIRQIYNYDMKAMI